MCDCERGLQTALKQVPQWMSDTSALLSICCLDIYFEGRKLKMKNENCRGRNREKSLLSVGGNNDEHDAAAT
jgi:hypothetical protein